MLNVESAPLALRDFHLALGARLGAINGVQMVGDYGDPRAEYAALRERAGVIDLSFRGRLCLTGADRVRFLHGQVTNDVKGLPIGGGCYAALVNAKGKMQGDMNILALRDELLLDFEPGFSGAIAQRFESYIVADDVQVTDVAPLYQLLSLQGPAAAVVIRELGGFAETPAAALHWTSTLDPKVGEIYLVNHPRLGGSGFDVFVPAASAEEMARRIVAAAFLHGGRICGWQALETARIEAGIPRYGADMDESNIPIECGIEDRAISYAKGCYLGQEVLNRIHSFGRVTKSLRRLTLPNDLKALPVKGDKLLHAGKPVGYITSATASPRANLALGYVRSEVNQTGAELTLRVADGEWPVKVAGGAYASDPAD